MGRDARLARSLGVDNGGNRGRRLLAHSTGLRLLMTDLRIEAHWQTWVQRHRAWQTDPRRDRLLAVGLSAVAMAAEVQTVDIRLVSEPLRAMGVPWYWAAEGLVRAVFPVLLHNAEHPDDPQALKFSAGTRGIDRGQAPPHDGKDIIENVEWWYRATVKEPLDSRPHLTAEYAQRENRVGDAHSVVDKGIERAKTLLNVDLDGRPARLIQ